MHACVCVQVCVRVLCVCARACVCVSVAQRCLTFCSPMDCSPPGSSVHGILQARILDWVAISSCRGASRSKNRTHMSYGSCAGRQILYPSTTWKAPYSENTCPNHIISIIPAPVVDKESGGNGHLGFLLCRSSAY